jgi:uncharacterized protein (DUF885 family)
MLESITPKYRDFLDKEYLAGARDSLGVSALPNGSEIYRALFRQSTTPAP